MVVDIWSDFVCPYCFVGKKRFEQALADLPEKDQVDVVFHTFRLDPDREAYDGRSLLETLASGEGMNREKAERSIARVQALGAEEGLTFNLDQAKPTNTTAAHRVAKFARSVSPEHESAVMDAIFKAYFIEGKLISDLDTLVGLAETAGLDPDEARAILENPTAFLDEIAEDERQAYEIYFDVVPHFLFDRKYEVSAVHPVEVYRNTLKQALLEKS